MKNEGKRFEEDFKKSIPESCWVYRLRDSAGAWQGGQATRFTSSNLCDFIVMARDYMYLLELKSIKGKSLPSSCIRVQQLEGLSNIRHPKMCGAFVINFRDLEKTYIVQAYKIKEFLESSGRKSVPVKFCVENGTEIPAIKKITRFKYSLENILI